ncbi:MAG: thiamine-phosphate kinase [Phormidesmis sp.]
MKAEGSLRAANSVAAIGELALIERLKPFCAEGMIGDDAALVSVEPGQRLVVTTDVLVDGVHFSDRTTPPFSVGYRATTANLSDLAAMGATPIGITVGLGLPGDTPWPWIEALYRGMSACLSDYGGAIMGGDLCRASQRTLSITALGQVRPDRAIYRNAAVPGMSVVVTGPHGGSRAGLAVLLEEIEVTDDRAAPWIGAHQQPVPRFDAIAHLTQLIQTEPFPPIAGMDSSDGLANALLQISQSSQVGMEVVRSRIPLPDHLIATVGEKTAMDWSLYGGEDFELVLCLPPDLAQRFVQISDATIIGTTTDAAAVQILSSTGEAHELSHQSFQGFQHF